MKIKKDLKKYPTIVNLISGPGCGKSILASELFATLKRDYISCDISGEYIKNKLREKAGKATQNQIYIFGKQQFQLFTLKDEVDVIITDSPLFFSSVYDKTKCQFLKGLILKEFNNYNNLNYYIQRDENIAYEQEGRYQDIAGAKLVDDDMKLFMSENSISYKTVNGISKTTLDIIVSDIKKELVKYYT